MKRREFIRLAASGAFGSAFASAYDWDRLLWIPKPMIVIPRRVPSSFLSRIQVSTGTFVQEYIFPAPVPMYADTRPQFRRDEHGWSVVIDGRTIAAASLSREYRVGASGVAWYHQTFDV
jgi:hypothetical protein